MLAGTFSMFAFLHFTSRPIFWAADDDEQMKK
jgi:hypothetical protein